MKPDHNKVRSQKTKLPKQPSFRAISGRIDQQTKYVATLQW